MAIRRLTFPESWIITRNQESWRQPFCETTKTTCLWLRSHPTMICSELIETILHQTKEHWPSWPGNSIEGMRFAHHFLAMIRHIIEFVIDGFVSTHYIRQFWQFEFRIEPSIENAGRALPTPRSPPTLDKKHATHSHNKMGHTSIPPSQQNGSCFIHKWYCMLASLIT